MSTLSRATGTTRPRNPRDYYPTIDPRAVMPLRAFLPPGTVYAEPCAGDGDLIDLLDAIGLECAWGCDVQPIRRSNLIARQDALTLTPADLNGASCFITNPPWDRRILHAMIDHLARIAPTWLLFDASWKETKQAARFGPWCVRTVSVGRLVWVAGTDHQSTDDCSWYLFDARHQGPTEYVWPTCNLDNGPRLI